MHIRGWLLGLMALAALVLPEAPAQTKTITWKKTVVSTEFWSEGVGIADVNKDGKMDILAGDVWFEGPDFKKKHEIRPPKRRDGKDASKGHDPLNYSNSFCCFPGDFNSDGWPDVIILPFPGEACFWYENPRGQTGHWKAHQLCHSACNETPLYVDLLGNGKKVLVMAIQPEGQMVWLEPGPDPTKPWKINPISEKTTKQKKVPGTDRFSHGLGVGDLNGDGRLDVICTGGWWEQPAKPDGSPWKFHPANLGAACADMHVYDVDGDGKMDVLSSSAHQYGIWSHQQRPGKDGSPSFLQADLFPKLVSQTHALHCVDLNGDGLKDLVTGKRWWAHGPKGDADPNAPARLYWFEAKKSKDGLTQFVPHVIDEDSGIGTQFVVADFNGDGLLDIVISNKKGTFVFEQVRK